VSYARLHIFTSVVYFIRDILLPTDLSKLLFSYLLFIVYHVIIMYTLFICTSTFSFSHKLIGSLSDDPRFARPDWMFYFIVYVFHETVHIARSWSFFYSIMVFLLSFILAIIFWFLYIRLTFYSISPFIWYHVWTSIYVIAVILIY